MTTIYDVAKLAGVSVATVSRTISSPNVVSPKTRTRVIAAIKSLNYAPNASAKTLRTSQSRRIVVTVPDIANPFFALVIRGIEEAARIEGYSVVLADTRYEPEEENKHAAMIQRREADGLIFLGHSIPNTVTELIARHDAIAPIVNGCEFSPALAVPSAHIDNEAAAREVMEHLYSLGHRRLGIVTGPLASPLSRDRLAGINEASARRGLQDNLLVLSGDFSIQSGASAAETLLALATRPTAIFCFSDEMAMGALFAARNAGLQVPDDVSIAGFDDIRFCQYTSPPLTTIHQPAGAIGRETVRLLMKIMQGAKTAPPSTTLPHSLVVRQSTGPARLDAERKKRGRS